MLLDFLNIYTSSSTSITLSILAEIYTNHVYLDVTNMTTSIYVLVKIDISVS